MSKNRSFFKLLRSLWQMMGKHRKLFLFGLFLGVVDSSCQALPPLFFKYIIDSLESGITDFTADILIPCTIGVVVVALVFFPAAYFFHVNCQLAATRFLRDLRVRVYAHVQSLSLDFFMRNRIGEISSRLNNDLSTAEMGLNNMMGITWGSFLFLQTMIITLYLNWKLSLIMSVMLLIVGVSSKYFLPKIRKMARGVRDAHGEASAVVTEYIGAVNLIKSMAREDYGTEKVVHASNQVLNQSQYFLIRNHLFRDILQVFARLLAPIFLLLYGGYLVNGKMLAVGDLVVFYGYWLLINGVISNILENIANIFASFTAFDRVLDYLEERPLIDDHKDAKALTNAKGEIALENISFIYPGTKETVLKNLTLRIEKGKHIALVGPSGSGKSTLLQLVQRFYDPSEGKIFFDGQDIRELKQRSLRDHIGFVMQESIFFAGSIADNLRLARQDATDEELLNALRNANALEFVQDMPDGVYTLLGEKGARLSGGQKQRLSIARVFLKNPPVLLFDEATSALDSISEKLVQEAMDRLMKNRTTITVAHRISTIQNADEIIVFHKGEVEYRGKHADLVKNSKLYHNLASHQGLAKIG